MRLLACLTVAALTAPAAAQTVPIFTTYATSPTSDVPGQAGLKFDTVAFTFDKPFVSPDGSRWVFTALNNSPNTADDEMIIVGGGPTAAGAAMVVREGGAVPFAAGSTWGTVSTFAGINDAGQYAFAIDTQPATAADQVVVRWTGTEFQRVAQEGGAAVGFSGVNLGTVIDSTHILANGDVRFRATLTPTANGAAVFSMTGPDAGSVVVKSGDTPAGQLATTNAPLKGSALGINTDRFLSDATGANTLYRGELAAPAVAANDAVVVFNGTVIAQEGAVLPGSGFASPVAGTLANLAGRLALSAANGHYLVRGSNADAADWVYKNGAVVAQSDAPITPGNTVLWDDTAFADGFFLITVGSNGSYVVGGLTSGGDPAADAVLVYNGTTVLAREGDFVPFDVDGNGTIDAGEGKFIRVFNNDDAFLTDGHFYFTAELTDTFGGTTSTGQAFLVVPVPEPGLVVAAAAAVLAAGRGWHRRRGDTAAAGG